MAAPAQSQDRIPVFPAHLFHSFLIIQTRFFECPEGACDNNRGL